MIICVTGTPGTGKTTFSKELATELGFSYVDVHSLIKEHKLYDSYDKKSDSFVVDTDKLNSFLMKEVKENSIVDSHLSHHLPQEFVDLVIVMKCELKELKERLEERKYSKEKVRENLDAEIFDVCSTEAQELGHTVKSFDSSKDIKKDLHQLVEWIHKQKNSTQS